MIDAGYGRPLCGGLVLGAVLLGCGPTASSTSSVAPPASVGASPVASGAGIVLHRNGPIGCDAIGVDYTSATIRIDADSDPDVWAETDTAKKLAVKWTDGFHAIDGSAPAILGPKGEEVARDGTKVDAPAAAYPRLAGYFVCPAPDALYILETDPQ